MLSYHFVFAEKFHGVDFLCGPVPDQLHLSEGASSDHLDHIEVGGLHAKLGHILANLVI